ncbi:Disease resistance protein [Camellia lanceoleosa]|uniref:Disease resistance protein n=1 Tax=Camellia lanceoleosa TaxID=1840588 RepID=A0ACC0ICV9_9ERIC|nr:Disease resistance protein [Camellia lanceoleosa]
MAGNIVLSLVVKIGEYLVAPVSRQFGYLIFYETNINNLENQVLKLEDKKFGVEQLVVAAETKRETIGPDVKRWLTAVNDLSQEATEFIEHEVKANKGCLNGWCPNLKSRYSLSRKATKKTQVVEKLSGEGNFPRVSYPEPPVGMASTGTRGFKHFESRRSIMKELMKTLEDDSINMIGICGMGGVGKTTMVKEVEKRAKEGNMFNEVVICTVSQSPEVKKIQGEIADILQFKLEEETELGRSRRLCARLKTIKRILVILDDVSKSIELNDIGIPFGDDHKGCKILLTSRFDYVCDDMGAQQKFTVEVLPKEEAWNLFKEIAGISNDPSPTTDLHCTQIEVANECGGLPIAIVTVGRALRAKVQSSWDSALCQLRKSIVTNIRGVDEKVFKSLELSYNYLESNEAQKLFLFCSLYPEDFDIPIEDLVGYGIGLELFKGTDTIGEARDIVHDVIDYLKKCYLLIDSERTECVKIHDIIRDVAISIASREEHSFMVRCDKALEDWPEKDQLKNYVVISLKLNGMHGLPGLEFPKLQLLNLDCNAGLPSIFSFFFHESMEEVKVQETPDSFYQGMKELRVLALSDVYGSLPTSLRNLTNLRTLSLFRCRLIDDDASVIGALENLEILRFAYSRIKELPKEIIGHLAHLKVLDLLNCKVERIYPGVLSSLSMLQELYIGYSFTRFGEAGTEESKERTTAIIAELASLPNLVALDIDLLNIKSLPRDWVIEKVKKFNIRVDPSHAIVDWPYYLLPNKLNLSSLHVTDLMDSNLKMLLKSTKILALKQIKGLKDILSDLDKDGFENLTNLSLSYCDDLEYLINKPDEVKLTSLEKLSVTAMDNLIEIWPDELQAKLREMRVKLCHGFSNILFPSNLIKGMQSLELLEVKQCRSVKVLFDLEGLITREGHPDTLLHSLTNMNLRHLPKLTHVWKDNLPGIQGLQNLTSLLIKGCGSLRYMFSVSLAKLLGKLQEIEVIECGVMEAIIDKEPEVGYDVTTNICIFPQLKSLKLCDLPNLRSLCLQASTFEETLLKIVKVINCPNLKELPSAFQCLQELRRSNVQKEEFLNSAQHHFLDGKFSLSSKGELTVTGIDESTEIWHNQLGVGCLHNAMAMGMAMELEMADDNDNDDDY